LDRKLYSSGCLFQLHYNDHTKQTYAAPLVVTWPVEAAPNYSDFNKFYDYSPDGGKWRFRFDLRGIGTVVVWGG